MNIVVITIIMYAAMYDLRFCKIPNQTVIAIIIIGLTQSTITTFGLFPIHSISLIDSCLGFSSGLIICLFLHYVGVFGAGDAKLLASLGTIVGFPYIILLISVAIFTAGFLSLLRLTCYGEFNDLCRRWCNAIIYKNYQAPKINSVASSAVPMGGAILLATMFCHFYLL
ncbi:prepilin peptidase [uncultured Photobacterium sp.]|uniref:A24 family peptidase n=1 Tax=uncultured Photobacterium sp. TaxID=173973 RepID=UPI0026142441|nr:A24 family peptidase [uncultured Photobacterium sp.]